MSISGPTKLIFYGPNTMEGEPVLKGYVDFEVRRRKFPKNMHQFNERPLSKRFRRNLRVQCLGTGQSDSAQKLSNSGLKSAIGGEREVVLSPVCCEWDH